MVCLRCGYEWEPFKNIPKVCPKCKSYRYNTESQFKQPQNALGRVVEADQQEKVSNQGGAV